MKNTLIYLLLGSCMLLAQESYYYKNYTKATLTPINTKQRNLTHLQYYSNEAGVVMGVGKKILLKVADATQLHSYVQEYKLKVLKELSKGLYLVENMSQTDTLEVANTLTLQKGVVYAHPDFVKKMMRR